MADCCQPRPPSHKKGTRWFKEDSLGNADALADGALDPLWS